MAKYQLMIRGENFLIDHDGKDEITGFFTTLRIESESPQSAEQEAVAILRAREDLTSITKNPPDDSPMLFLEEIFELDDDDPLDIPGGYTFFAETDEPEKRWWQFWK